MRILMTGGGSGGHIYPAIAFIKYVKLKDFSTSFLYVGGKKGLESKIVPTVGIPLKTLRVSGFERKISLKNFKSIYLFLRSIQQSKKIIKEFNPNIVIGTGGYVSAGVIYAATRLKIPTVIHEQNTIPGITNKFLSSYVDKIGVAFEPVKQFFPKEKTVLVGNPRAQEVKDVKKSDILKHYNLKTNKKTILIFAGSQGSLTINNAVIEAWNMFAKKDYQILYISGNHYYKHIEEKMGMNKDAASNISIQPYTNQMNKIMVNCDLVIGRAGATSIAEFTGLGIPSILIPSPYLSNDHQTKNAKNLLNIGACEMIKDKELTGKLLVSKIDEIMENDARRQSMALAAKSQGITDSSDRLYKVVKKLILERTLK